MTEPLSPEEKFDLELAGRLLVSGTGPDDGDWPEVLERARKHEAAGASLVPAPRRRRPVGRTVMALGLAAAAALALLFWPRSTPSLVDRAAAAVSGEGSVVHLIWDQPNPAGERVDIATGEASAFPRLRTEAWYDRRTQIYHDITTLPGSYIGEHWRSPSRAISSSEGELAPSRFVVPAVMRLFSRYQQALQRGKATLDGEGVVAGHKVYFLIVDTAFESEGPGADRTFGLLNERERIAIDRSTFRPVGIEIVDSGVPGSSPVKRRIITFELSTAAEADLNQPTVRPWPQPVRDLAGYPVARRSQKIQLAGALNFYGKSPVGLSPALAGLKLRWLRMDELNPVSAPVRIGLRALYGDVTDGARDLRGTYVQIDQAATPEPAYTFFPYDFGEPGKMAVVRTLPTDIEQAQSGVSAEAASPEWVGRLVHDGSYITIHASSRPLLLEAARAVVAR